jgi:hypothetical protein
LLEKHFPPPRRAPNRQTEILASVVLETAIPPGTLTQLRRKERRAYSRETTIRLRQR